MISQELHWWQIRAFLKHKMKRICCLIDWFFKLIVWLFYNRFLSFLFYSKSFTFRKYNKVKNTYSEKGTVKMSHQKMWDFVHHKKMFCVARYDRNFKANLKTVSIRCNILGSLQVTEVYSRNKLLLYCKMLYANQLSNSIIDVW